MHGLHYACFILCYWFLFFISTFLVFVFPFNARKLPYPFLFSSPGGNSVLLESNCRFSSDINLNSKSKGDQHDASALQDEVCLIDFVFTIDFLFRLFWMTDKITLCSLICYKKKMRILSKRCISMITNELKKFIYYHISYGCDSFVHYWTAQTRGREVQGSRGQS